MKIFSQKALDNIRASCNTKKSIVPDNLCSSSSGFTLFEVIIAVAILGISMVMVMQLFAAGLRSARASCDYTRAVVHGKAIMDELSGTMETGSGDFEDGFRWEAAVEDFRELEDSTFKLVKLIVKIYWPDVQKRQKTYEIVSLKMTDSDETP